MLVVPGILNGTPAVIIILSRLDANPSFFAALTAFITACLNLLTFSVTIQCNPQLSANLLAILNSGVKAIIGIFGLSRDVRIAVVPLWVKQHIAFTKVLSETSLAAY